MAYKSLPADNGGEAIQVLSPEEDTVQQVSIGATQQRITLPAESDIIELTATADCRVRFGDGSVVADANSRALLRGTYVYSLSAHPDPTYTHISVIRLTTDDSGNLTATRLK